MKKKITTLYLVYSSMFGIMSKVCGVKLGSIPFYENVLVRSQTNPAWQGEDEWTVDGWLDGLQVGGKLYMSVGVTGGGGLPRWAEGMEWRDCVSELAARSEKIVMIGQDERDFLYDRVAAGGTIDGFISWIQILKRSENRMESLGGDRLMISIDDLRTKKGIDRLSKHLGRSMLQLPMVIRGDEEIINKVADADIEEIEYREDKDVDECQVMTVIGTFMKTWADYRGSSIKRTLANYGITHDWTYESPHSVLRERIKKSKCKVFINEIWCCSPDTIRRLAEEFPDCNFINVNHSAPSYMPEINGAEDLSKRMEFLEKFEYMAYAFPNVYNGTVMDAERFNRSGVKVVSIPNACRIPDTTIERAESDGTLSLSLINRYSYLKNIPSQITAVCEVAKVRPVSLLITTHYNRGMGVYMRQLRMAGVNCKLIEWGDWDRLMGLIGQYVDIGLQSSLTESLNMVALEHMMLGKPVVGCEAIEYLPDDWKVNPQNPQEIAACVLRLAENLDEIKLIAKGIAFDLVNKMEKKFVDEIKKLIA